MNTTQTHEEWLASLKAGDQVATNHRMVGYRLYTVDRRTPSGRIVLTNGVQYDKTGREIGGDRWNADHLEEATDEVISAIKHRQLVYAVNSEIAKYDINRLRLLGNERLKELLAVLKKQTGDESER